MSLNKGLAEEARTRYSYLHAKLHFNPRINYLSFFILSKLDPEEAKHDSVDVLNQPMPGDVNVGITSFIAGLNRSLQFAVSVLAQYTWRTALLDTTLIDNP